MDTKEIRWLREEKYNNTDNPLIQQDIERLNAGEPLDYIIGHTTFLGCTIGLQRHPLIPRAETEFWLEQTLHFIKDKNVNGKELCILDLFAGSGCIGISLLKHFSNMSVTFGEQKHSLLEQIKENCSRNDIALSRITLCASDIFKDISGTFDYIFANPPYIAKSRKKHVQKSVLEYEPHEALFAPDNGLFYIKKVLRDAPSYLRAGGVLFIEFDPWQRETIERFLTRKLSDIYTNICFMNDQYNKPRVLCVSKK